MLDKNVRLAAIHAIDKEAIVKRLLRGYGVPIDTLETPEYAPTIPRIKVGYDPEARPPTLLAASGYSPEKPVKFTIQTTRGFKPKDYEMIQAIVGMWRKVGIEAEIEVYEIAKHYELRAAHKLAPMAFYNWGNAIGDPTTSTGFAMFGPSPHSAWKSADLDAKIGPLWGEKDEAKRIAGWKAVDKYIAEEGLVIPLLQYAQPVVYKSRLKVTPNVSGALQPTLVAKASSAAWRPSMRRRPPQRPLVATYHARRSDRSVGRQPPRHGRRDPVRRRGRGVRAAAGGARRPDRHDDRARRQPGRHRGAAGALRARRPDPGAVRASGSRGAARGDFGTSISLRRNVLELLGGAAAGDAGTGGRGARRGASCSAAALAVARDAGCGGAAGRPRSTALTGLLLAVPDFVWALALVLLFGVALPVFPLSGRIDPGARHGASRRRFYLLESLLTRPLRASARDVAAHMVMPVLALALPLAAVIARVLKDALREAMVQDYVLLARVKGLSRAAARAAARRCATPSARRWR